MGLDGAWANKSRQRKHTAKYLVRSRFIIPVAVAAEEPTWEESSIGPSDLDM